MGFFDFMKTPDINRALEEYDSMPQALLLDVRTEQEYRTGHIPGSQNVPLHALDRVADLTQNQAVPLFVYCQSGARSRQASGLLKQMGYAHVKNIGGIAAYRGRVVS